MTINSKAAKPGEVYMVTVNGARRVAQRIDPGDESDPWSSLQPDASETCWHGDDEVSELVPLAPVLPVTRDDLPSAAWLCRGLPEESESRYWTAHTLTKVLEHLNANGGILAEKPYQWGGTGGRDCSGSFKPSFANGGTVQHKSCCEDAALNAAEVDRLTRERDEWKAKFNESNSNYEFWNQRWKEAADQRDEYHAKWEAALDERDELRAKLNAAENRPTLDRGAVRAAHKRWMDEPSTGSIEGDNERLIDIMTALAPAVPSWPEWLGSRPVLRVPVRNVDDNWTFHDGNGCIAGDVSEQSCREAIEDRLADAVKWAGILSAIEAEEAERVPRSDPRRMTQGGRRVTIYDRARDAVRPKPPLVIPHDNPYGFAAEVVRLHDEFAALADELEREADEHPADDDALDENYRTAARIRAALEGGDL